MFAHGRTPSEDLMNQDLNFRTLDTCLCRNDSPCVGPSLITATVDYWPHTLVIDLGGTWNLSVIPRIFTFKGKNFLCIGCILQGGDHFTCVIRCQNAWLHYNGMDSPKFLFYPLSNSEEARNGRRIDYCLYQVLDEGVPLPEDVNWSNMVLAGNLYEDMSTEYQNDEENQEEHASNKMLNKPSISKPLKKLKERIEKENVKKKKIAPVKETLREKRILEGLSLRNWDQQGGTAAKCQGCLKKILHKEHAIRYAFKKRKHHTWLSIYQYHCKLNCLLKLPKEQAKKFLEKKWPSKQLNEIQGKIQGM
jgi:hypothetical protein